MEKTNKKWKTQKQYLKKAIENQIKVFVTVCLSSKR